MMTRFHSFIPAAAWLLLATPLLWAQDEEHEVELDPNVDYMVETATHKEVKPLPVEFKTLSAMRLDTTKRRLLACDGEGKQIKIIRRGKEVGAIDLEFVPESIDIDPQGVIYCGGQGMLAKFSPKGKLLKLIELPGTEQPAEEEKADEEPAEKPLAEQDEEAKTEQPRQPSSGSRRRSSDRPRRVSGIATDGEDVFVAYGTGWSTRSKSTLYRFDKDLENPKLLVEELSGCCQRCDIAIHDGTVYIAENARYRILALDRDGNELGKWGSKNRTGLEGFGSCCNPMNLCFDSEGNLYTAESGIGSVKRFSTDGELLDLVGYTDVERFKRAGHLASSCSNIAIAVTPNGRRVYVMDYKQNTIRVLRQKK